LLSDVESKVDADEISAWKNDATSTDDEPAVEEESPAGDEEEKLTSEVY
jgi:hypothetical protein